MTGKRVHHHSGARPSRASVALACVIALLGIGFSSVARASATEPVFDTTYDTRLGNILRGTMSTSSSDYLALQGLGAQSAAGDRTASHVLGQLQRVRAEIGDAVPLRKISIPGYGGWTYAWYDNADTYSQKLTNRRGYSGWSWAGYPAGSYVCSLSSPAPQPGNDFHQLYGTFGCYVESGTNYNEDPATAHTKAIYASGMGGISVQFSYGCSILIAAWTYQSSPCMAAIFPDHLMWDSFHPIGNQEVYSSQTYNQFVGYQWWDTSWNPFNAPTTQSTTLTDGRAKLDDEDNAVVRQWLDHLFDPTNYRAPLPVNQTRGDCSGVPNNLGRNACQDAMR